ncbi:TatD family hydrolase [Legionella hackeliae]|uniref:Putative metallodependent hydrolase n=1 Tax=Legionella hackeliae TaxID=449 RepID=A0A0A8UUP5_LEGHA|nr:TatD family hydrolase [Legionella hackeliae]KTD09862.1 deoxyribonuclease TatD [Legionella hackeliae]CEK10807.1 putative metallodependent hydrolase [Legionella hackeliae]STX47544.1 deoxyribonuclease TatD [Legionella hackeliae]
MLVDSHCHLNFIDLTEFNNDLSNVLTAARDNDVEHFLCVCVELEDYPVLRKIAESYSDISISVGIHPNSEIAQEPDASALCKLAEHPACIAIGETGLDYYRTETKAAQEQQRERFRNHIHAAITSSKPLIIHTRQAAEDTLQLMKEENAHEIGGVMHCFAEDWDIAQRALDLNFYISLSGIVTFKNATNLHEVAKKAPLDRLLIETDSPYLAPVPFRGKQNHPALVKHVAIALSELRQTSYENIACQTTANFYRCFRIS